MKTKLLPLFFFLFFVHSLSAQRFLGGELYVKQTGTNSVAARVNIVTSINEEMASVELCWGDGGCEQVPSSSTEDFVDSGLRYHQFEAGHVYGGENYYTLEVKQCCWGTSGIDNIIENGDEDFILSVNYFHSVNEPLFGENQMPFFKKGVLKGAVNQILNHNANLTDLEGDEVRVQVCEIEEVLNYNPITSVFPDPNNNVLLFDSLTSNFQWVSPKKDGLYVLALCVTERRNGVLISATTRYLTIDIDVMPGFDEVIANDRIKTFPNPAKDQLYIEFPEGRWVTSYRLFDTTGQEVAHSMDVNRLDLKGLSNGLYFLLIESDGQLFSKKVMVQR